MTTSRPAGVAWAQHRIDGMEHFSLVARATLLLCLIVTRSNPVALGAVAIVTVVVFLEEDRLRSPLPWFGLAVILAADQWPTWWLVDDHDLAASYWVTAIGLSRLADRPGDVLRLSARLLVGLVFGAAFAWKALSSQYTSTDFFRYTLVRDHRFEPPAVIVGGADADDLADDRVRLAGFVATAEPGDEIVVDADGHTTGLAALFTWWGLALEGVLAAAFLLPLRGRARWLRPVSLGLFCCTTYAVVPVVGFGMLLLIMGLAADDRPQLRLPAVAAMAGVLAWSAVFTGVVV